MLLVGIYQTIKVQHIFCVEIFQLLNLINGLIK